MVGTLNYFSSKSDNRHGLRSPHPLTRPFIFQPSRLIRALYILLRATDQVASRSYIRYRPWAALRLRSSKTSAGPFRSRRTALKWYFLGRADPATELN